MQTTGYEITFRAGERGCGVTVDLHAICSALETSRSFPAEIGGYEIVSALSRTCAEAAPASVVDVDAAGLREEIERAGMFFRENEGLIRPVYGFAEPGAADGEMIFARDTRVKGKPARLSGGYDTASLSIQVWPNAFRDYDVRGKLNVNTDEGLFLVTRANPLERWLAGLDNLKAMLDDALENGETSVTARKERNQPG